MRRRVIQFSHPGVEFPDRRPGADFKRKSNTHVEWNADGMSGIRYWNTRNSHFRKFIAMDDLSYLVENETHPRKGLATFWGEWEPHSAFSVHQSTQGEFMVHKPFIDLNCARPKKHNTDPFVYGNAFWYTDCKQARYRNVRELAVSSLILFGTERPVDETFLLDTVFVVKRRHSYEEIFDLEESGKLDAGLDFATISHGGLAPEKRDFGFYEAQMFSEDQAYFSFVPCRSQSRGSIAFHDRVALDVKEFGFSKISTSKNGTKRGAGSVCMSVRPKGQTKRDESHSAEDIQSLWTRIVELCYQQKFSLGVEIPRPGGLINRIGFKAAHEKENKKNLNC